MNIFLRSFLIIFTMIFTAKEATSFAVEKYHYGCGTLNRMTYHPNGKINTKYNVGTYQYANNSHAVIGISSPVPGYSPPAFALTKTSYNRPLSLTQQGSPTKQLDFQYNPDNRRNKTLYYENNVLERTMYYVGNYEKEVITGGSTNEYDYIYSPEGLAAIAVKTGGIRTFYYTHTDHLGSLRVVTTPAKAIQSRYHYDAWGTRTLATGTSITNRGFTGHEHLTDFGFINMNARLYDPMIGRFLAMDPFVQMPDYTQAYNRYSYAMNNPLIYVDEDGEFWHIIIGAVIGGIINVVANADNIDNFWQGLSYFGVGAASGALVATFPAAGVAIAGGSSAANSVLQQGFASNWQNVSFGQVLFSAAMGMATSAVGGVLGNALHVDKWFKGVGNPLLRNWLEGTTTNTIVGSTLGGVSALADNNPETTFWTGAWDGFKMGMLTGTLDAVGRTARYSIDNKVGFLSGKPKTSNGNYSVYQGIDAEGNVKYVGMTERDPNIRFNEHLNSGTERAGLNYDVVKGGSGLTKTQARIMEQNLINQYRMQKFGGNLYNQRNSIAPKYWYKYGIKP